MYHRRLASVPINDDEKSQIRLTNERAEQYASRCIQNPNEIDTAVLVKIHQSLDATTFLRRGSSL